MKSNKILAVFILIALIASGIMSVNRMGIESKNKTVDIVLDLDEIEKMVEQSDEDLSWWLKRFKGWGVNSVALMEENFESLVNKREPVELVMLGNVKKDLDWKEKYPVEFVKYLEEEERNKHDLLVRTNSDSLYNFIEEGLDSRYDSGKYKIFKSKDNYIFLIHGTEKEALYAKKFILMDKDNKAYKDKEELEGSKLMRLGLGYNKEKIDLIKESGLEVVLRASNYNLEWESKKYIETILNSYEKFNVKAKYMLFAGPQALGYPEYSDIVVDFMIDNNTKLALIESGVQRGHIKQKGTEEYASVLGYNAVRLFSMPPYIQERYKHYNYSGAEEIENTLYRAITERNVRLVYFRPFKHDSYSYVTDELEYESTFNNLKDRIGKHGIELGTSSTMKPNYLSLILTIFIGLGVLAGGMILISSTLNLKMKFKKIIFILGVIFIPIASYIAPNTSKTIFAIIGAMVYPSLSMVYFCTKLKKYYIENRVKDSLRASISNGIKVLVTMCLISFIGAVFVGSLLSSTDYLLEINVFRGVKIAQIMPILLYIFIFLGVFGYKTNKKHLENKINVLDLKELIFDNIQIITAITGLLIVGIGYVYIARTGHETDIQPSDFEMILRNFLEVKLLARPRTKEFLMAFPAVLAGVYMAINRKKIGIFILGLLTVIGQTSIVNTFSHLRTPMYLSILRTVYGIGFGILIGILYVILLHGIINLFKALKGEILNE